MNNLELNKDYPNSPGVYLMQDARGRVLYVGKASNLQKRLSSYFRDPDRQPAKTRVLLENVARLEYLCTSTDKEALLLESSLIKKHKPKYNIVLRDDKSYILFKLDKDHDYPRLSLTRKVKKDQGLYYGPFTSAQAARATLKVINRIFPLRKCKSRAFANRSRPCLQYQMKRCLAPCVLEVSRQEYWELVQELELFFSGRSRQLARKIKWEMNQAAEKLEYEKAAQKRDQLKALQNTVEQQSVVLPEGGDLDVLHILQLGGGLGLGLLFVRQGKVLDSRSFYWKDPHLLGAGNIPDNISPASGLIAERQKSLRSFLLQFYRKDRFIPERIILPFPMQDPGLQEILQERRGAKVRLCVAKRQREKRLLELVRTNILQHQPAADEQERPDLARLANKLGLRKLPHRIEAVDVSHLGGQDVLVGQVVFEDGQASPEQYRIYKFPELEGLQDDYQAMRNWVSRRLRSGPPWPDLVLIDGGKGHLRVVQDVLQQKKQGPAEDQGSSFSWELAAIAKESHSQGSLQDKVFRPGRKNQVALAPGDVGLLFLQRIRDEAHRFVLGKQKNARQKGIQSRLEELPGIGPGTARLLWSRFGSLQAICRAQIQELQELPGIGQKKAQQLQQVLCTYQKSC